MATASISAVTRGTAYELACMTTLHGWLGMQLYRTGGAGDRGIDLSGWWEPHKLGPVDSTRSGTISKNPSRIRILVQCKAESRQVGPNVVRELEGTMIRALWDKIQAQNQIRAETPASAAVVGIIASQSGFSKHAMLHMRSSKLPMLCLHLAKRLTKREDEKQLECRGFMWNDALASQEGPLQGRFEVAWICVPKGMHAPSASPHPVMKLYRDGVQIA